MSDYIPTPGYLYVLYNSSFEDGTYKLGRAQDLDQRKAGYTTPYVRDSEYLYTSSLLQDYVYAENMIKKKLADVRVRPDREFFKCSLDRIMSCFDEIEEFFKENDTIEKLQLHARPLLNRTANLQNSNADGTFICNTCNRKFTRKYNLDRHNNTCNIASHDNNQSNVCGSTYDENNGKLYQLKVNNEFQLIKGIEMEHDILNIKLDLANQLIKEKDERIKEKDERIKEKNEIIKEKDKQLELINTGELNSIILRYISNSFTKTGEIIPIKPINDGKCIKKQMRPLISESESSDESDTSSENNKKRCTKKQPLSSEKLEKNNKQKISHKKQK